MELMMNMVEDNRHLNKHLRYDDRYKLYQWILYPDDYFKGFWDV